MATHFVVRRLGWHQARHGDPYLRRLPSAEVVAAFDTFDAAESHRRTLEAEARQGANPFQHGGAALFYQTTLDAPRLHDWLLDEGIDPPVSELRHADWLAWWTAFAHTWTPDQLAHAWQGLDKVRFYDVAEGPVLGSAFVLLQHMGRRYGGGTNAGDEGGMPVRAYRSPRTAAAERDRRNLEFQNAVELATHGQRLPHGYIWDIRGTRPWVEQVAFYLVEVPCDVPRYAAVGHLVQRRAGRTPADRLSRVPVRLFADRTAADAHRDELNAAARKVVNPFHLLEVPDLIAEALEPLRLPLPWPATEDDEEWRGWWDLCQDDISEAQRTAVWELFADQPLFETLRVQVIDD